MTNELLFHVKLKRLENGAGMDLPAYANSHAAGIDVRSAIGCTIEAGHRQLVPTGFAVEIEHGFELQVRPRSGLALKHGVTILNSPGTIDSDYRGEVAVILHNASLSPFVVERGMRIAQLVFARVLNASVIEVDALSETDRGAAGFGSTGLG